MVREEIKKIIEKVVRRLYKKEIEIKIEKPPQAIYGDYSTNLALLLRKDPQEIIKEIKSPILEKIETKQGFINFFLSKKYLQKKVGKILKEGERFGSLKIGKNRKIQIEFVSANPTGPLTVGNSRGGPFGETLANVLKKAGFKVQKAYYINDYGRQILILGHSVLKDSQTQYKGDYIDYLNKKIKEKDPYKAGEKAAKIILKEMIKKTIDRLGIKYDEWIFETKLHKLSFVNKILEILKKKNLTYQKEGAIFFKSSKFGDERDRVLVKKDGWKTYLAGDIALHYYKFKKKKFDKVINIWGADHAGDVASLKAGVSALGYEGKLDIILLQFVTLFEKKEKLKMSKRLGVYVTMDELLDKIPLDVIKFFFLQKSANTHLNFDLDLAKEQSEKNPVYYIQYAYARICSILRKTKTKIRKNDTKVYFLLQHPLELELIKELIKFPEIIEDTARDYQIQRIPQYALGLASIFHQFYRDCKVLTEDQKLKKARLGLVLATKIVLKNTLNLMGILAPERM